MFKRISGALIAVAATTLSLFGQTQSQYGLPQNIQDGNILHCFCWPIKSVTENLESIAQAGYGAVQLSPLQRKNVTSSTVWYDPYRPYDYAFQETTGFGTADDLKNLCAEAEKYGIKVIVDVVANHVDKTTGYHDSWWDSNSAYVRSKGGSANINYGNRYSITHDRLGDYYELNTENADVVARAKAYVQQLHDLGVKGIRWDAAKHIELPSEGSQFWAEVTSVPDMFHYGEILGAPGPDSSIISEYASYISVTDSEYSDNSAKSNGGIPSKALGNWASNSSVGASKVVLWGESHDTYSNTPEGGGWSTNVSQAVIDRAYASVACRKGSAALYFSRPATAGFNNIKIAKGTDAYKGKAVKEVNKFRNKMADSGESVSFSSDKGAVSITRDAGGAVIVMKTSGQVQVPNGNSYITPGEYTDRVSGTNTFVVTATTITGEVGPSGIAVLYNDDSEPIVPDDTEYASLMTVYYDNSVSNWNNVYCYYWGGDETGAWPGVQMTLLGSDIYTLQIPQGSNVVFNSGDGTKQTENVEPAIDGHVYKGKDTSAKTGVDDMGEFEGVEPDPDDYTIYFDNSLSGWDEVYCHYWGGSVTTTWPGEEMSLVNGTEHIYRITVPKGSSVVFNNNNKGKQTNDVNGVKHLHIYQGAGTDSKVDGTDNGVYIEETTGIDSVGQESAISITTTAGSVTVEGLRGEQIALYSVAGALIYRSSPATTEVSVGVRSGIYILQVGDKAYKIAVK